VAKHDGTWRMVVDYKKLNNITIKDNHPLPNMEQTIQVLGNGYQFFSKFDMKSGFWQIPIDEEDRHKTAFITPEGLYEWNVLAQGLKNSPPSFQRVMADILSPCQHLKHIHQVLSILSQHNFQLNPFKCSIFRQQIDYLSHTISEQGVKPNNEKIQAIIKLREPSTLAEANKFLGAISWYHYPDEAHPVILTTDASKVGVGGTLQQHINGEIKNLYYHSQMTSSSQRRYDPIELEALAIWMCFQHMGPYLLGRSIIIYADQCPLCRHNCLADYLSRHPIPREEAIFDEDYGIVQHNKREPTVRGCVPDAIPPLTGAIVTKSKTKQLQLERNQNSTTTPTYRNKTTLPPIDEEIDQMKEDSSQIIANNSLDIEQLKIEQGKDSTIHQNVAEVMKDPVNSSYEFNNGLLYKLIIMRQVYHGDPLSGHFGVQRTYLKIKHKYWWPNMKQSIIQYIPSCLPCQQYNISRTKKPGRLQPIPPPEGPFQLIGMDYCGPFKLTPRSNQYVLCLTDYFTRWVVAIAVPDCSAKTTAEALFNAFICKYGVPTVIRSDQGTHFHNQLMYAMSKLIGYDHTHSTTYHPQSNRMIEKLNATFVPQIAKLQDKENNNWDEFLSPVVFAYNTGTHSTTQYSPFQLLYGREPRLPTDGKLSSFTFR
ncbi:unnamed protein product, partial [Rotaria magnacalcarata]